jgi:hypothetical protein
VVATLPERMADHHDPSPARVVRRCATARLQFVGAAVVAIDDSAAPPAKETAARYDPSLNPDQLTVLNPAVGEVTATPASRRIDGVDVTIDLGEDFLSFLTTAADQSGEAPTTTNGVALSTSGG